MKFFFSFQISLSYLFIYSKILARLKYFVFNKINFTVKTFPFIFLHMCNFDNLKFKMFHYKMAKKKVTKLLHKFRKSNIFMKNDMI